MAFQNMIKLMVVPIVTILYNIIVSVMRDLT